MPTISSELPDTAVPNNKLPSGTLETPDSIPTHHTSSWVLPSSYFPLSWKGALVLDVAVGILAVSVLILMVYYVRRQYLRRKLLLLLATSPYTSGRPDNNDTTGMNEPPSEHNRDRLLALKLKLRHTAKLEFRKKKSHVRWGSDTTAWDAEVGAGSECLSWKEEKGHSKSASFGDGELGADGFGEVPLVVPGDERQTRLNLRAVKGCDSFRGS